MTKDQFIDALFGPGWTEAQLPVFIEILRRTQEDAKRYYELRDAFARDGDWIADQKSLNSVDEQVDRARQSGLL